VVVTLLKQVNRRIGLTPKTNKHKSSGKEVISSPDFVISKTPEIKDLVSLKFESFELIGKKFCILEIF
jgi:hypothetical protein